ncbi:hypothetical protein B0H15DRAFT_805558 [Mycena belliarum]|uniref:Uncharacterized protein n=1 Tax=Mycena belliarum TaxID=1033014 RepID=A0AAD6TR28_9AGAR|nr:hypothetical protein B0H15DRAFT_805558 [Mycena belliae]
MPRHIPSPASSELSVIIDLDELTENLTNAEEKLKQFHARYPIVLRTKKKELCRLEAAVDSARQELASFPSTWFIFIPCPFSTTSFPLAEEVPQVRLLIREGLPPNETAQVPPRQGLPLNQTTQVPPTQGSSLNERAQVPATQGLPLDETAQVPPVQGSSLNETAQVLPAQGLPLEETAQVLPAQGSPLNVGLPPDKTPQVQVRTYSKGPDSRGLPTYGRGSYSQVGLTQDLQPNEMGNAQGFRGQPIHGISSYSGGGPTQGSTSTGSKRPITEIYPGSHLTQEEIRSNPSRFSLQDSYTSLGIYDSEDKEGHIHSSKLFKSDNQYHHESELGYTTPSNSTDNQFGDINNSLNLRSDYLDHNYGLPEFSSPNLGATDGTALRWIDPMDVDGGAKQEGLLDPSHQHMSDIIPPPLDTTVMLSMVVDEPPKDETSDFERKLKNIDDAPDSEDEDDWDVDDHLGPRRVKIEGRYIRQPKPEARSEPVPKSPKGKHKISNNKAELDNLATAPAPMKISKNGDCLKQWASFSPAQQAEYYNSQDSCWELHSAETQYGDPTGIQCCEMTKRHGRLFMVNALYRMGITLEVIYKKNHNGSMEDYRFALLRAQMVVLMGKLTFAAREAGICGRDEDYVLLPVTEALLSEISNNDGNAEIRLQKPVTDWRVCLAAESGFHGPRHFSPGSRSLARRPYPGTTDSPISWLASL